MLTAKKDLHGGRPLWQDSPRANVRVRKALQSERCDVAIVGGGVSGALSALMLSRAGFDVVVLDRRMPGSGSTAASTAMIQFEIDTPLLELTGKFGREKAERAYLRSFNAVAGLKAVVRSNRISAEWRDRQALYLAGNELGWRALKDEAAARKRAQLPSQFLDSAEVRDRFGIERTGAILSDGAAELNPAQLTSGALDAAKRHGCRVYAKQEVNSVETAGKLMTLGTVSGPEIVADRVIFATGYETIDGLPKQDFEITSSWAIATKPIDAKKFWPTRCLIWEASDPYLYLRTTADNRVVAGGEDSGLKNAAVRDAAIPNKAEKIMSAINQLLPGRDFKLDYAWAGAFAESPTGLPIISELDGLPRCLSILGCGGNGITFSHIAAEIATAWASGKRDRDADLFEIS